MKKMAVLLSLVFTVGAYAHPPKPPTIALPVVQARPVQAYYVPGHRAYRYRYGWLFGRHIYREVWIPGRVIYRPISQSPLQQPAPQQPIQPSQQPQQQPQSATPMTGVTVPVDIDIDFNTRVREGRRNENLRYRGRTASSK